MRIDCHVHVSACLPGNGSMSPRLLGSLPFRFMRWRLGIKGYDEAAERAVEKLLADTLNETTDLDAAVILAFDATYTPEGNFDAARTHLHVTNDYVISLAAKHPKMLFGASVHPYRKDAVAEVERCVKAGAVLMKWLPLAQGFNPADERCIPVYEAMAHHGLPLLSHTGGERALPVVDPTVASPALLEEALRRGVTVIAAHCGTAATPTEQTYIDLFVRMAREHERFYGDTAALNLPFRCGAYDTLLKHPDIREKLLHGSDWPIIALPSPSRIGWGNSRRVMSDRNWMRRDITIKRHLGLDDADLTRAAGVLRLQKA